MKIYTEVVWEWDESKGELVEVSSESFDYEGPLVKADFGATMATIAAVMAIIGTATQIKGGLDASAAKAKLGRGRRRSEQTTLGQSLARNHQPGLFLP